MAHARAVSRGGSGTEDSRFFELSLDFLCTVTFDGYFKRINPAWTRALGWTEDELLAQPYVTIIHPEDRERTAAEAQRIAEEREETRDFDIRLLCRDGSQRWVSFSAAAGRDEDLLYVVGRDVTDSRRSQAALRDSELRLRSVTDSVADAVVSADGGGRISFWNPGAARIFGYEESEVLGRPLTMLMPERYRSAHEAGLRRHLETGERRVIGTTLEVHGLCKDGREIPIELSLGDVELGDGALFTGVIREISARRRSERYLATQLAVAQVMTEPADVEAARPRLIAAIGERMGWRHGELWTITDDGHEMQRVSEWNEPGFSAPRFGALADELRFSRGEGLAGRVWAAGAPVWVGDMAAPGERFPRAEAAASEGVRSAIGLPLRQSGELVGAVAFYSGAIERPDEELLAMMSALGAQIGEFLARREAEAALARAVRELERQAGELQRSNADLEQFAYVASHDLSEPLRMVAGFVTLLARRYKGRLDGDADEFIGYAVEGVERMQELIEDLLVYSRVGRGEQRLDPVDTRELVQRVLRTLGPRVEEAGAEVALRELPVVRGDEAALGQLFQNLIVNAVKFRGERPPRVEVGARREGAAWRFWVSDNGIGIEPRHVERIFKVFQRLHGRDEYPGTGIGLAICQRVVERRGGRIEVGPGPDGGSEFSFTIPDSLEGAT